jgi:hypothetical protein
MDPTTLLKALLIHAAYQGATAVCEPLIQNPDGKPIPIDPLIQDVGLQQKGVLVYEEAKVQYAAILRAFQDKTGIWPDPKVSPPATDAAGLLKTATDVAAAVLPKSLGTELAAGVVNAAAGAAGNPTPPHP